MRQARLVFTPDLDADNPRDFAIGHMVCWHSRDRYGDDHQYRNPDEFLMQLVCDISLLSEEEIEEKMEDRIEKAVRDAAPYGPRRQAQERDRVFMNCIDEMIGDRVVMLPVYLLDHGNVALSVTPFRERWDSGQIGWTYITLAEAQERWNTDKGWDYKVNEDATLEKWAEDALTADLETYSLYCNGDVWSFLIEEVIDGEPTGEYIDSCSGYYGLEDAKQSAMESAQGAGLEVIEDLEKIRY